MNLCSVSVQNNDSLIEERGFSVVESSSVFVSQAAKEEPARRVVTVTGTLTVSF